MSSWARPGVKCVCVDSKCPQSWTIQPMPVEGEVYEIASVHVSTYGEIGIHLVGVNETNQLGYAIWRFRPLITQSDDVALFAHHLTGTPVREVEPC